MTKIRMMKKVKVSDTTEEDLLDLSQLLWEEYQDSYPDKKFYDNDVLKNYIHRRLSGKDILWKVAKYEGKIIGTLFAKILNPVIIAKLAIVRKKYNGKGVMKLISMHMLQHLNDLDGTKVKALYAFVESNNTAMKKIVETSNYKLMASVPNYRKGKNIGVYVRLVYDFNWKTIKPCVKLYPEILHSLKVNKIPRYVSINPSSFPKRFHDENDIDNITLHYDTQGLSNTISFLYEKEGLGRRISAQLRINKAQKSWYDFRFLKHCSPSIKLIILKKLVLMFQESDRVNSLSLTIGVNDQMTQYLLYQMNIPYYGYLPYFLEGKDAIIMGISKIKKEVK